jgi:predicted nuclease with TOPRIM domain
MKKLQQLIQLEQEAVKNQSSTREEFLTKGEDMIEGYQQKFDELQTMLNNKDEIITKEVEKRFNKLSSSSTSYEGKSLHKDAKKLLIAELNK